MGSHPPGGLEADETRVGEGLSARLSCHQVVYALGRQSPAEGAGKWTRKPGVGSHLVVWRSPGGLEGTCMQSRTSLMLGQHLLIVSPPSGSGVRWDPPALAAVPRATSFLQKLAFLEAVGDLEATAPSLVASSVVQGLVLRYLHPDHRTPISSGDPESITEIPLRPPRLHSPTAFLLPSSDLVN